MGPTNTLYAIQAWKRCYHTIQGHSPVVAGLTCMTEICGVIYHTVGYLHLADQAAADNYLPACKGDHLVQN